MASTEVAKELFVAIEGLTADAEEVRRALNEIGQSEKQFEDGVLYARFHDEKEARRAKRELNGLELGGEKLTARTPTALEVRAIKRSRELKMAEDLAAVLEGAEPQQVKVIQDILGFKEEVSESRGGTSGRPNSGHSEGGAESSHGRNVAQPVPKLPMFSGAGDRKDEVPFDVSSPPACARGERCACLARERAVVASPS